MSAVTLTAANISSPANLRDATVLNFISGATLSLGQAVYLDASNLLQLAIATSAAAAAAIGIVVGVPNAYAETSTPAGNWVAVCIHGLVQGWTTTLVSGQPLYVSKTVAGGLDTAAPATAYDYIVGNAEGADSIFVRPGQSAPVSVA